MFENLFFNSIATLYFMVYTVLLQFNYLHILHTVLFFVWILVKESTDKIIVLHYVEVQFSLLQVGVIFTYQCFFILLHPCPKLILIFLP